MHRTVTTHRLVAVVLAMTALTSCMRPGTARTVRAASADSVEARAAAVRFLAAFDSLQWAPFRAALAPDVTVFMPGANDPPARLEGRDAVEATFSAFFARVREARVAEGSPNAPFLNIGARLNDVRVQVLAPGAAIVSFHLRAGQSRPSRRTAVFRRESDGVWRLVHLHASGPPSAN